jgi:hypothetical protein
MAPFVWCSLAEVMLDMTKSFALLRRHIGASLQQSHRQGRVWDRQGTHEDVHYIPHRLLRKKASVHVVSSV